MRTVLVGMLLAVTATAVVGCGAQSDDATSSPNAGGANNPSIVASNAATTPAEFAAWLAENTTDGESVAENAGSGMSVTNAPMAVCARWPTASSTSEKNALATTIVAAAADDGVTGTAAQAAVWLDANCRG